MRWWFRALAGGKTGGDLAQVSAWEAALFGSTRGASAIRIVALNAPTPTPHSGAPGGTLSAYALAVAWGFNNPPAQLVERLRVPRGGNEFRTSPIQYLGYGAFGERPSFAPGTTADLRITWPSTVDDDLLDLLRDALWAWLHLGGLGLRSRRGFGSLAGTTATFSDTDEDAVWADLAGHDLGAFAERLRSLRSRYASINVSAGWSHFTSTSTVHVGPQRDTWDAALQLAGAWMIAFRRRYGVPSDERHPLQDRDYVWGDQLRNGRPPRGVPDRAGFGLPLPFGQGDRKVTWGRQHQDHRRASPLLLHIGRFGERQYRAVLTHLPAALIPDGEVIRFKALATPSSAPTNEQKGIVREFLDDLAARKLITSYL